MRFLAIALPLWVTVASVVILILAMLVAMAVWLRRTDLLAKLETGAGWWLFGLSILCVLLVWLLPALQVQKDTSPAVFEMENEARRTVVQICGGLFAILGFALAIVRIRKTTLDLKVKETEVQTGRFAKLAELLGQVRERDKDTREPALEVRVAAIYALGRLAEDSDRDRPAIAKVLAGYVRLHALKPEIPVPALLPGSLGGADSELTAPDYYQESARSALPPEEPRIDIQAALEILFAFPSKEPVDLHDAYLAGVQLRSAQLRGVRLSGAILRNANLEGADMVGTMLRSSVLASANLQRADLRRCCLVGADFDRWTRFDEACLTGAQFWEQGADKEHGLRPGQIQLAGDWESAHFSPEFEKELEVFVAPLAPS